MLRIRIRIHVFLGLQDPDPDPLVRGMDPDPALDPDPDPSIIMPKIVRKTLIPTILWLFLNFYLMKNDVNVASKSHKQKKFSLKIRFLLASWRSMTKKEGSGSGSESISQRHGSADPDPDPPQNAMDPQNWHSVCQTSMGLKCEKLWFSQYWDF